MRIIRCNQKAGGAACDHVFDHIDLFCRIDIGISIEHDFSPYIFSCIFCASLSIIPIRIADRFRVDKNQLFVCCFRFVACSVVRLGIFCCPGTSGKNNIAMQSTVTMIANSFFIFFLLILFFNGFPFCGCENNKNAKNN